MSADNRHTTQMTALTYRQPVLGSEASQGASRAPGEPKGETSLNSSVGEGLSRGLVEAQSRGRKSHPVPWVQTGGNEGRLSYFKGFLQAYSVTCFKKNCFKI